MVFLKHYYFHQIATKVSLILHLEFEMPFFGGAINELDITLHFFHDGPARKTLEDMQEKFHKNLTSLPKCTFYRNKNRLVLDFEAKFTTGYEIQKNDKPPISINPEWVKATLGEIINQLPLIKSKIKKSDDFDFNSFESYITSKFENIPLSISALEKIEQHVSEYKNQTFDKLDDWEKLGIDWDDYHPNARTIIKYSFQWSGIDDFSPNGNDTGADVLSMFKDWNKRNKKTSPLIFIEKLLTGWEVDINNPYDSEYTSQTYFQSIVGLAFASYKLNGECDEKLKEMAISAIDKYLKEISAETNWEYLEECQKKQNLCKQTLEKM